VFTVLEQTMFCNQKTHIFLGNLFQNLFIL